jgi:nitroreductase
MADSPQEIYVDQAIQERKTLKVLANEPIESSLDSEVVEALLESAAWAPFHRPADKTHCASDDLNSKLPWRSYVLDASTCRTLRNSLLEEGDITKVPAMLATASNLIQVTWLPNPKSNDSPALYDPSLENMEHIAAASAAIQNLLIAATARNIQTYWSSGGCLRKPKNLERLGIPIREILLGSIFLFPVVNDSCTANPGKLRDLRGEVRSWSKWVELEG